MLKDKKMKKNKCHTRLFVLVPYHIKNIILYQTFLINFLKNWVLSITKQRNLKELLYIYLICKSKTNFFAIENININLSIYYIGNIVTDVIPT